MKFTQSIEKYSEFLYMLNIAATSIGMEHTIEFVHCDCEPHAVTMIRAKFWPATLHSPRLVFPFSHLDWAELLLLECQVSLKDFCTALYFRCPYPSQRQVLLCTTSLLYMNVAIVFTAEKCL